MKIKNFKPNSSQAYGLADTIMKIGGSEVKDERLKIIIENYDKGIITYEKAFKRIMEYFKNNAWDIEFDNVKCD